MNKVEREREDVLRAELARLCWLVIHDKVQGGESERLLHERLAAARDIGTSKPIGSTCSLAPMATDRPDPCRQ